MFDHDFVYVLPAIANAAFDIQVIVSRCGLFFFSNWYDLFSGFPSVSGRF